MLLSTFTSSPFQSTMLYHKPSSHSCSFYLLSFNYFKLNLLIFCRSCLYSNNFSTSLISSIMWGFLEKSNSPLLACREAYTSNGVGQLSYKEVPQLDGCLDPSLQSNFSPWALPNELELTCCAFSQAIISATFAQLTKWPLLSVI
jgi:hypothetical protein